MKQRSFYKKFLVFLTFLFSLILGATFSSVDANTTSSVTPGAYTASVSYKNADNPDEDSMIESGGLWNKSVKYTVAPDGSSDLTIKQDKMMNYMTSVNFVGQDNKETPLKMTKTIDSEQTGSWKVHLDARHTAELKQGNELVLEMKYTVPNLFSHDVNVLMYIDSVHAPDQRTYEQRQNLKQQSKQLQGKINSLLNQINGNRQLTKFKSQALDLQKQTNALVESLNENNTQLGEQQKQVKEVSDKIQNLENSIPKAKEQQNSNLNKQNNNNRPVKASTNKSYTPDGSAKVVKPQQPISKLPQSDSQNNGQKSKKVQNPGTKPTNTNNSTKSQSVNSLTKAGKYTAHVSYNKTGDNNSDTGQPSMIQTDQLWDRNIKLVKSNDGSVTVTIKQPKMLNYMSALSFDGVKMQEHKQEKDKGQWTVQLPVGKASDLKKGNKILVSMKYTVPGMFTHDVTALVVINSITTGDAGDTSGRPTPNVDKKTTSADSKSDQVPNTAVGYDQRQGGSGNGTPVASDSVSGNASLPQTGKKEHNNNHALTVGLFIFLVIISGVTGFTIYRRIQNA